MGRKHSFIRIGIFFILVFAGCAPYNPSQTKRQFTYESIDVSPPFEYSFIKQIAVVEFSNYSTKQGAGKILADRIEQFLVEKSSYSVMSRMDLDHIMRENNLSAQGALDPKTAQEVGKLTGLDALIVGNVENYDMQQSSWQEKNGKRWNPATFSYEPTYSTFYKKTATIVVTFKVIKTKTGQVVWSKTSDGDYWRKGSGSFIAEESDYKFFEHAMSDVLNDAYYLFPHKSKRKVYVD